MKFYQKDHSNAVQTERDHFNPGTNLYWDVKDFHWLKNNVKSPNFDVYSETELEKDFEVSAIVASFEAISVQDAVPQHDDDRETKNSAENAISKTMENDNDEDSSEDEL